MTDGEATEQRRCVNIAHVSCFICMNEPHYNEVGKIVCVWQAIGNMNANQLMLPNQLQYSMIFRPVMSSMLHDGSKEYTVTQSQVD